MERNQVLGLRFLQMVIDIKEISKTDINMDKASISSTPETPMRATSKMT